MIKLDTAITRAKEMSEKRMAICKQCEFYKERTSQCRKCGCFMRFKTTMSGASCPIGKWSKE